MPSNARGGPAKLGPRPEIAAVLASHGDRAGAEPNAALLSCAEAVRRLTGLATVTAGVLKGTPALEEALAAAAHAREILVYPLLMADGYFAETVLPGRIRAAGLEATARILPPLGRDPALTGLLLAEALDAASNARIDPAASRLLVVGHGSKFGPRSAEATRDIATAVRRAHRFATVATAFLEEAPFLAAELGKDSRPTIVSGFFFGDGMHAGEDIPRAIRETGANAIYAGPIGHAPRIPELIAEAISAEIRARAV